MSLRTLIQRPGHNLALTAVLTLLAGIGSLATPLAIPMAQAQDTTACTENARNGCTELSPTPPSETVAVPPNIVLMLDDSGSMGWNYMPDWGYLQNNDDNDALINANNNGVYYNPTVTYPPPPKADGSSYPSYTDMSRVTSNGFLSGDEKNLFNYSSGGIDHSDSDWMPETITVQYDENVKADYDQVCVRWNKRHTQCKEWDWQISKTAQEVCNDLYWSEGGTSGYPPTFTGDDDSGRCTFSYETTHNKTYRFFQYSTGPANGPYDVHYVASASQGCGSKSNCVVDSDTSGIAAPAGIVVGTNIANWFAYYHIRMLMAKSGLMTAFNSFNPNYRFGFGSINGHNRSFISGLHSPYSYFTFTDGNNRDNYIAQAYPFGASLKEDGTANSDSRRFQFWNWLVNVTPSGDYRGDYSGTPLRKALVGAGEYYKTDQPWTTMQGDPGYEDGTTTKYACRASYTILTTDGFWNGSSPKVGNVDNEDGPTYSPPAGSNYTTNGYTVEAPFKDDTGSTLADVAMKYWANDLNDLANLVAPSGKDPAFWQHMTTYTVGLGFSPLYADQKTPIPMEQVFAWARTGLNPIADFAWPAPSGDSINNIADLAHAAVNGHGDFFSVKSPQELAAGFARAIADINARNVAPTPKAGNASVIAAGALNFSTGYNTGDWSGSFQAVEMEADGSTGDVIWDAGALLDAKHSPTAYSGRKLYTLAYSGGTSTPFEFKSANAAQFDTTQTAGLSTPALGGGADTLANRIDYLQGDSSNEGTTFRTRNHLLGSILRSEPLYVSYPSADYSSYWPAASTDMAASPEMATGVDSYDDYKVDQADRGGVAYVGANDGMLHAFNAPAPNCTDRDDEHNCTTYDYGSDPGKELWAYVPRAVYANLGNLTSTGEFSFRPTVDEAPVSYDVFFDSAWHTIVTGGVGAGGRGVYALDVTDPTSFTADDVLWELDSDMTVDAGCVTNDGTACKATDLGYTIAKPNVARLANGKWVVLVPNGYFPDCTTPDMPTPDTLACQAIAAQAPRDASGNPYSALFVLDAETGAMIAELKTPSITGVKSYALSTPVLGDYDRDQVDDVGFAGDAEGNLWRFDFSGKNPANWKVTLAYQGVADAKQPITTRPRLLSDPVSSYFIVVFGTGKYLGVGDNSDTDVQALYGIRDQGPTATSATAYVQTDLTQQFMHETTPTTGALAGVPLRCITSTATGGCSSSTAVNFVPTDKGGWFINLEVKDSSGTTSNAGERVVVDPGAVFATNQVIFQTLITGSGSSDPCSPLTVGAVLVLNGADGGAAGVSALGGLPYAGARIENARTSGSVSAVQSAGGGSAFLPGVVLPGVGNFQLDVPIWRRRSWQVINPGN